MSSAKSRLVKTMFLHSWQMRTSSDISLRVFSERVSVAAVMLLIREARLYGVLR